MAQKIGIKIDDATSADGRNFYKAMDFLAQYVGKDVKDWPYQQISEWDYKQQEFCKDLYRTSPLNSARKDYLRLSQANRMIDWADRFNLLYVQPTDVDNAYAFACKQLQFAIGCADQARKEEKNAAKRRVVPRTINKDGSLAMIHPHDWCSGLKNHFRPDYSSYHVIDYNPETGEVRKKQTAQGYSDDSFWSRGQAWGLYGYTTRIASHIGGYDEWKADITDAVAQFRSNPALVKRFGGKIPIAIRCDNSRDTEMIPSDMSDFNLYGGLYRYVNLVYVPAVHFSAIQIDTDTDEKGKVGTVNIKLSTNLSDAEDADNTDSKMKKVADAVLGHSGRDTPHREHPRH